MYCTNCGREAGQEDKFCNQCGSPLELKVSHASTMETVGHFQEETDFEYDVKEFVGKNIDYYERKWQDSEYKNGLSFNIAGFLLSPLWLGYRKMYKPIFFIAIIFLISDLVLYLIGYTYSGSPWTIDPVDRSIGVATAIVVGMLGNKWYKHHVERHVQSIRSLTQLKERTSLLKSKGGTSWKGAILGLIIVIGVYIIPMQFIPLQYNEVDNVKYGSFYEFPDIYVDDIFRNVFEEGDWEHTETIGDIDYVDYNGVIEIDGKTHDMIISFYNDNQTDEMEIMAITVDGVELPFEEATEILNYIFLEYED